MYVIVLVCVVFVVWRNKPTHIYAPSASIKRGIHDSQKRTRQTQNGQLFKNESSSNRACSSSCYSDVKKYCRRMQLRFKPQGLGELQQTHLAHMLRIHCPGHPRLPLPASVRSCSVLPPAVLARQVLCVRYGMLRHIQLLEQELRADCLMQCA